MLEKIHTGEVRRLSSRLADAEIDRRLPKINWHKLTVDIGDVQQRNIAEGIEPEQFSFG